MKTKSIISIGRIHQLGLAALLTTSLTIQAQTPISQGHADIGIAYEDGAWDLHVHDHDNDIEYSPPTDALYVVKPGAITTVPINAEWSFLGSAGSDTWILPKVQNPNLLFLGVAAEEIGGGIFVGDQLTLSLQGVSGPGNFAMFDNDQFNNPIVLFNSADGFGDLLNVPTGSHVDYNFAFSAPGQYTITFEASGTLTDGNVFTSSGNVDYLFEVQAVPEPGSFALIGLGIGLLAFARRK